MHDSVERGVCSRFALFHLAPWHLQEVAISAQHLMLAVPRQLAECGQAIHNRVVVTSDIHHNKRARQVHRSELHAGVRPGNNPREDEKEVVGAAGRKGYPILKKDNDCG